MRSKFYIVLIAILVLSPVETLLAQKLTNAQRRQINLKVYSLLEDYTRYGKLSSNYATIDESYIKEYVALFGSSANVFNDILPYNRLAEDKCARYNLRFLPGRLEPLTDEELSERGDLFTRRGFRVRIGG